MIITRTRKTLPKLDNTWKRCPSVYSGGKPYFYVRQYVDTGKVERWVWDRLQGVWSLQIEASDDLIAALRAVRGE